MEPFRSGDRRGPSFIRGRDLRSRRTIERGQELEDQMASPIATHAATAHSREDQSQRSWSCNFWSSSRSFASF